MIQVFLLHFFLLTTQKEKYFLLSNLLDHLSIFACLARLLKLFKDNNNPKPFFLNYFKNYKILTLLYSFLISLDSKFCNFIFIA